MTPLLKSKYEIVIFFKLIFNIFSQGDKSSDVAFAIYYGKFQGIAPKAAKIISLVENRIENNYEYESLLNELQKIYLSHRASVSSE